MWNFRISVWKRIDIIHSGCYRTICSLTEQRYVENWKNMTSQQQLIVLE